MWLVMLRAILVIKNAAPFRDECNRKVMYLWMDELLCLLKFHVPDMTGGGRAAGEKRVSGNIEPPLRILLVREG